MGTVSVSLPSDGETIDAADYNTPITTIVNEINGQLDNANIASDAAIAGTKLADNAITTAKIADGQVTAVKLDSDATGHGFLKIGSTTAGSAGDSVSVSFTAKKYLMVVARIISTGGTTVAGLRFNSDTASNYNFRYSTNGGADTATGTQTVAALSSGTNGNKFMEAKILNVAAAEKLIVGQVVSNNAAGVGNVVDKWEATGKWVNTSDQISSIQLTNSGSGDFDTGTELVVYGHD